MFNNCSNYKKQGEVGVGQCIAYLLGKGYTVSLPIAESQRYDLIFDDGKLNKVEVKTTSEKAPSGFYICYIKTCGGNRTGQTIKHFDPTQVDYLFILSEDGIRYLIPTDKIQSRSCITLNDSIKEFKIA